jgi:glycosyltransferase involved in cell wall biosynthesis
MLKNKKIGIVVPAYNEERFIGKVLESMPKFVDRIYVVDDASKDSTSRIALDMANMDKRIAVIKRETNGGVGAAIISGHKAALKDGMDVAAVMAGDGQMPPAILSMILDPVVSGKADYAKGNRISTSDDRREMPKFRVVGTFLLTILTRISSGYWHISDPQNGYTAIGRDALLKLDLDAIYKGFAFENDMLVRLNIMDARVIDVPHQAIYRGQTSKIKYPKFIMKTSWMLLKSWIWRLWVKYIKRLSDKKEK